jgi:hypothetical protein
MSSPPYNKELVESLAQMISKTTPTGQTAYLNMNHPKIPEGLNSRRTDVSKIGFALFTHGVHTCQTFPEMGIDPQKRRGILKIGAEEVIQEPGRTNALRHWHTSDGRGQGSRTSTLSTARCHRSQDG